MEEVQGDPDGCMDEKHHYQLVPIRDVRAELRYANRIVK